MNRINQEFPCPCGSGVEYELCFECDDDIEDMMDDDCPLCQMMSGRTPEFTQQGESKGEFYVNVPLVKKVQKEMIDAMKQARVRPEIIYAFETTGLLLSEDNSNIHTDSDFRRWADAVDEYRKQN